MSIFSDGGLPRAIAALEAHGLGAGYERFHHDLELGAFGPLIHDAGDCPGVGIALLDACSAGFDEPRDRTFDGDLAVPRGQPLLVHGDLHVAGSLTVTSQLLVTGNLTSTTVHDCGPDSFVTVLGDVKTRGLWTGGRFYVRGKIVADLVWAIVSGDWLSARRIEARAFVEWGSHPIECDDIDAAVNEWVTRSADAPLAFRLADIFAHELYRPSGEVDAPGVFEWLDAGRDIFATEAMPPSPMPLEQFRAWLKHHPNDQRTKLAALTPRWTSRLAQADPADVATLLEDAFTSPKLRAAVERLREELVRLRAEHDVRST